MSTQAFNGALSFRQLERLWIEAGGAADKASTAAAIALAESGGKVSALNNNPATGDYSVGPWQINYFGSLAGSRTQQFGPPTSLLSDPLKDARAAVAISNNGSDFSPWTTYTSGRYSLYLGGASAGGSPVPAGSFSGLPPKGPATGLTPSQNQSIANALLNGQITPSQAQARWPGIDIHSNQFGTFGGLLGDINSVKKLIEFVTSWRFAEVVGGFVLLLVGLVLLGRQFGVSVPVPGPAGKAAGVVSGQTEVTTASTSTPAPEAVEG